MQKLDEKKDEKARGGNVQKRSLALMRKTPEITVSELAKQMGIVGSSVKHHLTD